MSKTRKGISKSYGSKKRLIAARKSNAPSPRWIDLKIYGITRAMRKTLKRFRSKHWRRNKLKL